MLRGAFRPRDVAVQCDDIPASGALMQFQSNVTAWLCDVELRQLADIRRLRASNQPRRIGGISMKTAVPACQITATLIAGGDM